MMRRTRLRNCSYVVEFASYIDIVHFMIRGKNLLEMLRVMMHNGSLRVVMTVWTCTSVSSARVGLWRDFASGKLEKDQILREYHESLTQCSARKSLKNIYSNDKYLTSNSNTNARTQVPRSGQSNKTYSKLEEAVKELDFVLDCTENSISIHNVNELKTKLGCDVWDVKESLLNEEYIKDHFSLRQSLPKRQLTQEQFDSVRSAVHCVVENNVKDRSVEVEGNMIVFKGEKLADQEVHGEEKVIRPGVFGIYSRTQKKRNHIVSDIVHCSMIVLCGRRRIWENQIQEQEKTFHQDKRRVCSSRRDTLKRCNWCSWCGQEYIFIRRKRDVRIRSRKRRIKRCWRRYVFKQIALG